MPSNILVVGSLNYDIILKQQRLPLRGETYAVDSATICPGGKGANQAVQCAKLGVTTHMAGAVGGDEMGDYLKERLDEYGVNRTHLLTRSDVSTGLATVSCLPDGSVYANIVRGANFSLTSGDLDGLDALLDDCFLLIVQLEIPVEMVNLMVERASARGIAVMINTAPALDLPENLLSNCNYIIANEVEAGYYCKKEISSIEAAQEAILPFAQQYGAQVVFTMGEHGSVVCDGVRTEVVPPYRVEAVETTGAGDSFVGGLAYALSKNMNLFDGARFATACSALTVCGIGAQPSMPTLEQVEEFLRKH